MHSVHSVLYIQKLIIPALPYGIKLLKYYIVTLGLSEFFYISGNGHIFTHNEDNWKSLLEGYGLVHIDWKPKTKTDVIFVETIDIGEPILG